MKTLIFFICLLVNVISGDLLISTLIYIPSDGISAVHTNIVYKLSKRFSLFYGFLLNYYILYYFPLLDETELWKIRELVWDRIACK